MNGGMANVSEIAINTSTSTDDRFKDDDDNDNGCEFIDSMRHCASSVVT